MMSTRNRPPRAAGLAAAALALAALVASAQAKVDLVTLPDRGEVQITIYNAEDLTLVRERRTMTFRTGINEIQFSWANTLIDPTSLDLRFREQAERFRILDVTYPPNTQNTLIWRVEAQSEGPGEMEILYFTSGLSWQADYVARASADEKTLTLESYVRVTNRSGEDYENTQTRLLVGEVRLVEKIAELARREGFGMDEDRFADNRLRRKAIKEEMLSMAEAPAPMAAGRGLSKPKEIEKEGVSDYFLYTIEGRETLRDQWSKRLPSFRAEDVPIEVRYEYDAQKYGPRVVKIYKFKNKDEAGKPDAKPSERLGETPLPEGVYRVFREGDGEGLSYVNAHSPKYIPIGEEVELNLGDDGLITLEVKTMDFQRENIRFFDNGNISGHDIVEERRIEVRNSKPEPATIEVTQHFGGDFEIETEAPFEKRSATEYKFTIAVPALGKTNVDYRLTTRHGENSTKPTAPRPRLLQSDGATRR